MGTISRKDFVTQKKANFVKMLKDLAPKEKQHVIEKYENMSEEDLLKEIDVVTSTYKSTPLSFFATEMCKELSIDKSRSPIIENYLEAFQSIL
eukprot:JP439187.1.p1 GENE.JP439187.1~~JP439187.1.p1  ORF type:complete len:93 (-),score=4.44 JP439187.1:136-414(-)